MDTAAVLLDTDDEWGVEDSIYEYVKEDFNEKISFDIDNVDEIMEVIKQKAEELKNSNLDSE